MAVMELDPQKMPARDFYRYMIGSIVPRPIAWVSTLSPKGVANLAPFSFFNAVGANPPTVVFCPANKRDGSKKDTLLNIEATKEFVINIVPFALANVMNDTSAEYAYDESEFDFVKIERAPSQVVKPPRVKSAPVHIECTLTQIVNIGDGALGANLVIGRILWMNVDASVLDAENQIDPRKLDAIGRMGGIGYARTTDLFDIVRPITKS